MRPARALLALALLLLLPAPARASGDFDRAMKSAAGALSKRGRVDADRIETLRNALADLPRAGLSDEDWLDLNIILRALDRRLDPPPAFPAPADEPAPDPADIPGRDAARPGVDAVALVNAARTCRRLLPPARGGPAPEAERAAWEESAGRARRLHEAASALAADDALTAAAAAVLADAARDLRFDLSCRARGSAPCGTERFAWLLRRRHGLSYSPEEVRAFGEAARERILARMTDLAREIDPKRSWREITEESRADHPATTEELAEFCRRATDDARELAGASGLVTVPEEVRAPVVTVLPRVQPGFPTPYAMYRPGRAVSGGYAGGEFVVTALPPDLPPAEQEAWLRGRDVRWVRVICGHEAIPGHHLQYARAAGVKSPYRRFGHTSTYVEGWGLYSEDLMDRAGAFGDARARMALLRMRLWRAVRVIVDVGLHTGGMRPSQAVQMLVDQVMMDRWTAEREVERYLTSPTQPLSYLVGYEKIRAIRRAWLARHGAGSERDFHDRFLGLGPVPLDLAAAVLLGKRAAYDASHP